MGNGNGNVGNNNGNVNINLLRAESDRDNGSSASTQARDAMEGFSPDKILGGLAEIFKVLGGLCSG